MPPHQPPHPDEPAQDQPPGSPAVRAVRARLDAAQSTEEAARYLDELKLVKADLLALARDLSIYAESGNTVAEIKRRIVRGTTGARLDQDAILRGTWNPGIPKPAPDRAGGRQEDDGPDDGGPLPPGGPGRPSAPGGASPGGGTAASSPALPDTGPRHPGDDYASKEIDAWYARYIGDARRAIANWDAWGRDRYGSLEGAQRELAEYEDGYRQWTQHGTMPWRHSETVSRVIGSIAGGLAAAFGPPVTLTPGEIAALEAGLDPGIEPHDPSALSAYELASREYRARGAVGREAMGRMGLYRQGDPPTPAMHAEFAAELADYDAWCISQGLHPILDRGHRGRTRSGGPGSPGGRSETRPGRAPASHDSAPARTTQPQANRKAEPMIDQINQPAPDAPDGRAATADGGAAHDEPGSLDQALAAAARQAGGWLAAHPAITVPAAAAVFAGTVIGVLTGSLPAAAVAAMIAALIAWPAVLRVRRPRPPVSARLITGLPGAWDTLATRAPGRRPAIQAFTDEWPSPEPEGMAAALRLTEGILAELRPGPELVTAADPETTAVRWDTAPLRPGAENNLPEHRADKMRLICGLVRSHASNMAVLHQIPQLLLTADDGAVIELFGRYNHGRTGTLATRTSA